METDYPLCSTGGVFWRLGTVEQSAYDDLVPRPLRAPDNVETDVVLFLRAAVDPVCGMFDAVAALCDAGPPRVFRRGGDVLWGGDLSAIAGPVAGGLFVSGNDRCGDWVRGVLGALPACRRYSRAGLDSVAVRPDPPTGPGSAGRGGPAPCIRVGAADRTRCVRILVFRRAGFPARLGCGSGAAHISRQWRNGAVAGRRELAGERAYAIAHLGREDATHAPGVFFSKRLRLSA